MRLSLLFTTLATVAAVATTTGAQPAPRVMTGMPAADLTTLDKLRKQVWVDWFTGDTASLRRVLGPELVAISAGEPHWQSLDQTIAGSAAFKRTGATLVSVTFDSTMVHRSGDVVVMFSHYAVVTQNKGTRDTQKGRATEVFVRHAGRWVHTSWHLDSTN
jgi:ketosteroid isomerase-like protein